MGGVQPVVPRGQPHLPMRNRMMGNPAKLQDGIPVILKVTDVFWDTQPVKADEHGSDML